MERDHIVEKAGQIFRSVLERSCEGVRFLDADRRITFWNKGAELITGFTAKDAIGQDSAFLHFVCKGNPAGAHCPVDYASVSAGEALEQKVFVRHKDGYLVPVILTSTSMRDEAGREVIVEMLHDLSWKENALEHIENLNQRVLIDSLTGLGNRKFGEMTVLARIEDLKRYNINFGLAFVDLDDFKLVNDRHGHNTGDRLLQVASKSLSSTLRPSDSICRWAGDEFIVVASNIGTPEYLMMLVRRLQRLVRETEVRVDGAVLKPTVSIGATLAAANDTVESIVERADRLMYKSKSGGKDAVTVG